MSFLTIHQNTLSNKAGQSKWVFSKLVSDHGFSNTTPRILVIGDNGTQTLDIIDVFPT